MSLINPLPWYRVFAENDGDGGGDAGGGSGDGGGGDGGEGGSGDGTGGGEGGDGGSSAAWFADDWRTKLTNDITSGIKDESQREERTKQLSKRFERFASPKALADSYLALEQQISAGEFVRPLGDKPTDKELATYREQHGVPPKPEGYLEDLPNGLVIGEEDKPEIERYLGVLHEANVPKAVADKLLQAVEDTKAERIARIEEADADHAVEIEDALRAEYSGDYRQNIARVSSLLDNMGTDVAEALQNARTADGRALLNVPGVMQAFVNVARELMPTIEMPGSGGTEANLKNIETRLAEISKLRRENRADYNKNKAVQEEERELIRAQERLKAKAAA